MSSTGRPRARRLGGHARAACALALLFLLSVLSSCGQNDGDAGASGPTGPRYGYGPEPNSAFTYQPDVVIIGGASDAIRSVRGDGLVWTLDGKAPGVRDLAPGKIMFATSNSVGRVVKVEPAGEDFVVTLAPVELTEVVRDGLIAVDQPIDIDALSFQVIPDFPGAFSEDAPDIDAKALSPDADVIVAPTARLIAPLSTPGGLPPVENGSSATSQFGDWDIAVVKGAKKVSLTAQKGLKSQSGLKVEAVVSLLLQDLRVRANVPIAQGAVGPSTFIIDGITGFSVDIAAGVKNGVGDNRKIRIEFPIEITQPILLAGFPATLKYKFKFLTDTLFTAKDGNLSASGVWRLDGPIGFDGSTLTLPQFSIEKSIIDSLQGVSFGINGIFTAVEFRFSLGLGLPVASAGPYAALIGSIGVATGSALGIAQCRHASLVLSAKGGVGITMSPALKKGLEALLGQKVPAEMPLVEKKFVDRSQTTPPLCQE